MRYPPMKSYLSLNVGNLPVDYADLAIIDLSEAATEEGRVKLADQVSRAMHEQGSAARTQISRFVLT